jgi:hypothetical protein
MEMNSKRIAVDPASKRIIDRRFLFKVGEQTGKMGLVGEVRNRLIVFLAALTAKIRDKKRRSSVMAIGPSGSGKTVVIEVPLRLFPSGFVVRRASFTRQALAYGQDSLDGRVLFVDEYRGGKEAQYLLRILQSEGEIAHEFTVGRKTDVRRRFGSPVVMTTTTQDAIFEDDMTRFLAISIDDSTEQNRAVLKSELSPKAELDLKIWQEAIQLLWDNYKQPFVFPSWFDYIAEQVPAQNVRTRRDWKRFLGLMEAIAMCSPDPNRDGQITFADYSVAHRLLNFAFTASVYTLNENELRVQTAVKALQKELGDAVTIKQITDRLDWNQSLVYKYVRAAVEHDLIKYEPGTREKNVKRLLFIEGASTAFLPHPKIVRRDVKDIGRSVDFVDPLTGELGRWNPPRGAAA